MQKITTIEDLRIRYQKNVPKMFYDYTESGSWTQKTLQENSSDFSLLKLRQKVAVDMSNRTTKTKMIGQDVTMPVALAPVGLTGMQSADGEIKAARAAENFGLPYTLSTMSICSIEDVAENTNSPFWFQLYVMKDQAFLEAIIERAKKAKCSALVLTLDLQLLGQRHLDIKNGLSVPLRPTLRNLFDLATKLKWSTQMLRTKRKSFGNIVGHVKGVNNVSSLMEWTANQFDLTLDWNAVAKIKKMWGGKLILKGILDAEDAKKAVQCGVDAIIVSNHGGRQLDGASSSIRILPDILEAVNADVEIHMDGGIRSGQDVLKAIAMGAKGTYIGRSYIYGLGAAGEAGVKKALEIIHKELDMTMALCGHNNINDLSTNNLLIPKDFQLSKSVI
ncbi:alpha-hydroxy-acid oxidizing protein [Paracoccaceae bacterium]|jgi:L-lactate dehydrogenase (cytochrome)|nr:alpha-hydroxy-acid oxidizing protein [Paracoccaceae bacterium]MDA9228673.1 alpha-hydroxy-acid oxidizing protein [Paracoccaceae bacterium]MDB4229201.1 alpha-hydroxy-acid oxidizing protein [Paracoccaceae bacterium]MDC1254770.1 alpha-hydroxy-acid oxidizing protein [Paracoccaceae bacterium]|tara:strand:- start:2165 stop:3334 length:1170 start_codon:yes stop_codon:yes gene_type:complete